LGLTIPQIEFLYEARQRALAGQRADFVADVQRAVNGSMGEAGHKAMQSYIARLEAIERGTPAEPDVGYTGDDAVVL
jgi:hypothetical protein